MKATTKYENKKVLVLGLARSGVAAAKLLNHLGAFVTVNDAKSIEGNEEANELLENGVTIIAGSHPVDLLDEGFSLIVKNPGIPYTNPILEQAIERKIPIMTEVELAYQVSEAPIVGITGTNGKTTTTTMIGKILEQSNLYHKVSLAGNIGFPASEVVTEAIDTDILITELSSFQLMGVEQFKPEIAVITNLFEAHLDYHGSRKEYVKAKWNIQNNMTASDCLVFNANQEELIELARTTEAKLVPFSSERKVTTGAYLEEGKLYYQEEYIMDGKDLGVPGIHNIENALAAICVAKLLDTPNAVIKESLMCFSGVPHRTEYLGTFEGRKVYNDSKATNILATQRALSGFDNQEVVLIAGGLDRGNDFVELEPDLIGLKGMVVMGETADKLAESAKYVGIKHIEKAQNMTEAVSKAFELSEAESVILLSPSCASWDQYKNFEIRGDAFASAIKQRHS